MFNHVIIEGRITAFPELKVTSANKQVTNFTVAVDSGYGDKKRTDFIDCVAWEKSAENICKYFSKGSGIGISGRLSTMTYEDKNGYKRKKTEIVVNEFHFPISPPKSSSDESSAQSENVPAYTAGPSQQPIPPANYEEYVQLDITADDDVLF